MLRFLGFRPDPFRPERFAAQAACALGGTTCDLVSMFAENFAKYEAHVAADVKAAALRAA